MEILFEISKLLIIAFVLSDLGEFLSELIPTPHNKYLAVPVLILKYWLSCAKCFSFWLTIILTGNLFISALVALIINYAKKIEYKYTKNNTQL